MSTSLLVLERNIGKELGYASGTCSAAGTTLTLLDTSADSPIDTGDSDSLWRNAWLKIESDTATTPLNVGEVRRIKSVNVSTQTLTVATAFTNATTTTQSYGVYFGMPPIRMGLQRGILEYINDALRNLYCRSYVLLTLVDDGDMESSSTATYIVNATAAKASLMSAGFTEGGVLFGNQYLQVTNSALGGYAAKNLIVVTEGNTYSVMAEANAVTGTARLQLYDQTNSAVIDAETTDQAEWQWLYFTATIPSGCESVMLRLVGDEANAVTRWRWVSLRRLGATTVYLPDFSPDTILVNTPNAIEDLQFWWPSSSRDSTYALDDRHRTSAHWFEAIYEATGTALWRIDFSPTAPSDTIIVAKVIRPFKELSADTDTTTANPDLVKAAALARIYQDKDDKKNLAKWLPIYAEYLRAYQPRVTKRIRVGV